MDDRTHSAAIALATTLLLCATGLLADVTPTGSSYMLCDNWGGTWTDAEKLPDNSQDDLMCWAAAASNVLEWTGWGNVAGMSNSDQMFTYYQNHWTDEGGLMEYGWDWWFDGTNPTQGSLTSSQVDVPGGGFHPDENFNDYYFSESSDRDVLSAIDTFTRAGYGVTLGLYGPGGHAITCWGFNYDPDDPSEYYGIWVTDSDDSKTSSDPADLLRYYEVQYQRGRRKWYLQDYYGTKDWYIGEVQALATMPDVPIPLMGDADHDWDVDDSDLNLLLANFGLEAGATWEQGDFDDDGDVDDGDLNLLLSNFGATTNTVPEPGSLLISLVGAAAILGRRKNRRR